MNVEFGPLALAAIARRREEIELSQNPVLREAKRRRALDDDVRARAEASFGKPHVEKLVKNYEATMENPVLVDAKRRAAVAKAEA